MNPVVLPDRPQNAMLDIIEGNFLSLDAEQFRAPWSARDQSGRNIDVAIDATG